VQAIEMVHAAAAIDEPYDLILMDMQMPVMDGWEATRRLRAEGHSGPIFALTGRTQPEEEARCLEAGCDAFFSKPLERSRLIRAINEYTTHKEE
jgi:CheY-like chemotaxis protein